MGKDSFTLSVAAAALSLAFGGCAVLSGADREGSSPSVSAAKPPQVTSIAGVAPAVAYDDGTPAPIRQTDFWKDTSETVKKGVDRVAQAANPAPPVKPPDDPTSLNTKAKPSPELFVAAAQVHESAGRIPQAESSFQQAFRIAPKHLPTHLAYARFKDRQKQSREALEIYLQLAKDYPNDATVFNDLGLYYARRGMNREAIGAFDRAVQLQPKRQIYRNNFAVVLVQAEQLDAATSQLMAVYTEAETCYKLGYLLQKKGDNELALQYFARAAQLNPQMAEARQWYEHLRSRTPPRARADAGPAVVEAPPAPASREQFSAPRVAERPKPDVALPPSTPAAPLRSPPLTVRQLPPAPKRLPAAGPQEGEPPLPGTAIERPASPKGRSASPTGSSSLPDAPMPPPSRPVPLPPVSN